jgi:hypothetical protein
MATSVEFVRVNSILLPRPHPPAMSRWPSEAQQGRAHGDRKIKSTFGNRRISRN